jgi:hypothetical protein
LRDFDTKYFRVPKYHEELTAEDEKLKKLGICTKGGYNKMM